MNINTIQVMQFRHPGKRLLQFVLMTLLLISPVPLGAQSIDDSAIIQPDYVNFWSDYRNIFLFQPKLIKKLFTDIVDIKGSTRRAKRLINNEVLGCRSEVAYNAGCRIDQLNLERKKQKLSSRYTIPVNFTGFSYRPYKNQKNRFLLRLSWRPALFRPPLIEVDTFLDYINAARDSKIYALKSGLKWIQIVPDFQKHVEIIVGKVMATNLRKLYQEPNNDYKDSLTFVLESTHNVRENGLSSFTLNLKAVSVKINHQIYRVQKDSAL